MAFQNSTGGTNQRQSPEYGSQAVDQILADFKVQRDRGPDLEDLKVGLNMGEDNGE